MLVSRVTTALVKFLAPVSSATDAAVTFEKSTTQDPKGAKASSNKTKPAKNGEKKQDQKKQEGQSDPNKPKSPKLVLRLVHTPPKPPTEAATVEEFLSLPTETQGDPLETAESSRFIHLFSHFQKQKSQLNQKIGLASYQAALGQKSAGMFKKGSILDTYAD
ncbi:MAG: hypothetical protein HYX41_02055 [Bdellovibrio sp.]|nr:hypothetical protein [Bdellovibrio sp.]